MLALLWRGQEELHVSMMRRSTAAHSSHVLVVTSTMWSLQEHMSVNTVTECSEIQSTILLIYLNASVKTIVIH